MWNSSAKVCICGRNNMNVFSVYLRINTLEPLYSNKCLWMGTLCAFFVVVVVVGVAGDVGLVLFVASGIYRLFHRCFIVVAFMLCCRMGCLGFSENVYEAYVADIM